MKKFIAVLLFFVLNTYALTVSAKEIPEDDIYVPPPSYDYVSKEFTKSITITHGLTSDYISFMADMEIQGYHGYNTESVSVSRRCVMNQETLHFSYDLPFKLDVTVWECPDKE